MPSLPRVLVKDPNKKDEICAFFSTDTQCDPIKILEYYVLRWNVEVTFQESRRHLGIETQRQWSDKAILGTTPALMGVYSLICLMGMKLNIHAQSFVQSSAWYVKNDTATFSDVLAIVRRRIWSSKYFLRPALKADIVKLSANDMDFIINQLARTT